jgi:hypothetical protein
MSIFMYIKETFRMAFPFQGSKYKECTYVNEIGVSAIISISCFTLLLNVS